MKVNSQTGAYTKLIYPNAFILGKDESLVLQMIWSMYESQQRTPIRFRKYKKGVVVKDYGTLQSVEITHSLIKKKLVMTDEGVSNAIKLLESLDVLRYARSGHNTPSKFHVIEDNVDWLLENAIELAIIGNKLSAAYEFRGCAELTPLFKAGIMTKDNLERMMDGRDLPKDINNKLIKDGSEWKGMAIKVLDKNGEHIGNYRSPESGKADPIRHLKNIYKTYKEHIGKSRGVIEGEKVIEGDKNTITNPDSQPLGANGNTGDVKGKQHQSVALPDAIRTVEQLQKEISDIQDGYGNNVPRDLYEYLDRYYKIHYDKRGDNFSNQDMLSLLILHSKKELVEKLYDNSKRLTDTSEDRYMILTEGLLGVAAM